jgi:hypothetical protein
VRERAPRPGVVGGRLTALTARTRIAGPAVEPAACVVAIIERPDPDGRRWDRVLEILLEAGRRGEADEGP